MLGILIMSHKFQQYALGARVVASWVAAAKASTVSFCFAAAAALVFSAVATGEGALSKEEKRSVPYSKLRLKIRDLCTDE